MLSISNPGKGASDGARYYLDERTDYYPVGDRHFSAWFGRGARRLQLQGTVERSAFYHVLNGYSPDGTQPLVQNARDPNRQCYWDLTFSAPKSVSVLWALAPAEARQAIEQAHRRAVERALAQVEATVGLTRRGPGGRIQERVALVFATFQEYASRALDPQIHTHAVLVNLGLREDGTTGALQTRDLFRAKLQLGAVYQDQLARELRQELGLTIERDRVGYRIMGVPRWLCRKFSKRRQAIEQALEDRGAHNAIAAKVAALDTPSSAPPS